MDGSVIFLFAVILIIGTALFALMTLKKGTRRMDVDKYRMRWLAVEQSLVQDNEPTYHLAVLNADKLLDQALRDRGFAGKTMGDRLKSAKDKLPHRDNVWNAHKLRNRIAHEPDVKVGYKQARIALAGFKQGLKDLGAV